MDFKLIEQEIAEFWEKHQIYEKSKKGKRKLFRFLDGPPYASGSIHLGTAFNKVLKDFILRVFSMKGFRVWDRPGYDMHGLPIEVNVEKKFGIENKKQVLEFGVDKFIEECKKFAIENMWRMNKDFQELGVWMDWSNPYKTLDNSYIENVWYTLKFAFEKGFLYEGDKVLHWCYRCATALAKHELEYKQIKDTSIYVKFRILGKEKEFLIIWTTTPWTLISNLAVMVNPDEDYVRIKVGEEIWILAKERLDLLNKLNLGYEVLEEFKGSRLEGVKYEYPLLEEVGKHKELEEKFDAHKVILSKEYVNVEEGTGLVHCAPGCGPEDFEVGKKYGLPPFSPVDENGLFTEDAGLFSGKLVKGEVEREIVSKLEEKGLLVLEEEVTHEYPHCWRCKKAVIFRATKQWFLKVSSLKEEILKENEKVKWIPRWAKTWFDSWISQLEDWCVSRQRFWGIPLPIFKCESCGKIIVVGSKKELEELSKKKVKDLHIPEVDNLSIDCECGGKMRRVSGVADVWIDSGSAPWASVDYLNNRKLFEKLFPYDLILEGKDQIRGWFNSLFCLSMLLFRSAPFKNVYMHGFFTDEKGREMHKSLGNYVEPKEVISRYGRDVFRLYCLTKSSSGEDIKLVWKELDETLRNLNIFWNLHFFILKYAKFFNLKLDGKFKDKDLKTEDKWILSTFYSTLESVEKFLEEFELPRAVGLMVDFYLEKLSRGYIHLIREDIHEPERARVCLNVIYHVYKNLLKLLAPAIPFTTEKIYQDLKEVSKDLKESVHLEKWPRIQKRYRKVSLEKEFEEVELLIDEVLALRDAAKLRLRQPLKELILVCDRKRSRIFSRNAELLKKALNIKNLNCMNIKEFENLFGRKKRFVVNFEAVSKKFSKRVVAEIIRRILEKSYEDIKKSLRDFEKVEIKLDSGEIVELGKEDLLENYILPKNYLQKSSKLGLIVLNTELTKELRMEGLVRELLRSVQAERKRMGFEKEDKALLYIDAPEEIREFILKFKELFRKRTNCELNFVSGVGGKELKYDEFKINFALKKSL